jgi:hypothetical protein
MKPLKFKIGSQPEISTAVQKTLFALGYKWHWYGKKLHATDKPYLIADECGDIWTYNYGDEPDFEMEEYPLVDLFNK